jgi:ABC-type glutathione transport system ATPase component
MQIVFQDPFASLNPRMRVAEILEEGPAAQVMRRPVADYTQRLIDAVQQAFRNDLFGDCRSPAASAWVRRTNLAGSRCAAHVQKSEQ